jgi:hypothetical protein
MFTRIRPEPALAATSSQAILDAIVSASAIPSNWRN